VLGVVGEEVAALVGGGVLAAVVDEAAGDRGVAAGVRVGVERAGARRRARALGVGPAVVGAPGAEVHLLLGGVVVVAADVADEQPARRRVVEGPVRVAE